MRVPDSVKKAYASDSTNKYVSVYFPETNQRIAPEQIDYESMELTEALMSSGKVEFVGCIASIFQIKIRKLKEDIKGRKITVQIYTDGTEDKPVTLFNGIVDSALKKNNKQIKEVTAYDVLYTKGGKNVGDWYKGLTFPISLKELRDSLFGFIGITQEDTALPNDDVMVSKKYNPEQLKALDVIKALCQINGACGIINREEKFEYRILGKLSEMKQGSYPSPDTCLPFYPENPVLAAVKNGSNEFFSYYREAEYEDYTVKPVDKVTIRQTEEAKGVTYGTGTNNYIVQGNMFTLGLKDDVLSEIAHRIYDCVGGVEFRPFTGNNNGLPFVEVGLDSVSYNMFNFESLYDPEVEEYTKHSFYVLNRELTGVQALKDTYKAQGEEYQTEFITDLQTQIDILKKNTKQEVEEKVEDYTYSKEEIDNMFPAGGGWNVESVPVLPVTVSANTIYLIQGEVTVE